MFSGLMRQANAFGALDWETKDFVGAQITLMRPVQVDAFSQTYVTRRIRAEAERDLLIATGCLDSGLLA